MDFDDSELLNFQPLAGPSNINSDEDDMDKVSAMSFKERRREAHTQSEQKRRDAIKRGYDDLFTVVPTCHQAGPSGHKLSKASILLKSIEYIQYQLNEKRKQEEKRDGLRKQVLGLQIMLSNYEQIVKAQQSVPSSTEHQLTDVDKFRVFQGIMDELFESFDQVSVDNFADFSAGVFNWLEQYCKPQHLSNVVETVLRKENHI